MTTPKFSVAIVGGGIAGLTLAIALGKYPDIQVCVYEAASKFGELGVGLGFTPRAWDVFEKLGVTEELLKYTDLKPFFEECVGMFRRKSDQPEGFVYYKNMVSGRSMVFHRADCQTALLAQLTPSCKVSLSKRLASYTQEGHEVVLHFEDGSTAKHEILVGSDGYKSVVRKSLLQERAKSAASEDEAEEILGATEPLWSGAVAYRGVIPSAKVHELHPGHSVFTSGNAPVLYSGPNSFIVAYPIQHEKLVNLATFHVRHDQENTKYEGPHASQAPGSEFAKVFEGFEREVETFTKCVDHITKWAIHTVKPMKTFVYGHVALAGDAAHAMTPFLGAGAGQAVEDAYILGTVLGHPNTTRENLRRALEVYDAVRRPLALKVQEHSRMNGRYHCLKLDGYDFENRVDQDELWADIQRLGEASQIVSNSNSGTIDPAYEETLRMLQE